MSQIGQAATANFSALESAGQAGSSQDAFNDLGIDGFLSLIISELQNQDPLDPAENSEIVAQFSQIREIGATDQLTNTLGSLATSQELVTASSLIGRTVNGIADDASAVEGVVDRITVEADAENGTRSIKVQVGEQTIEIDNIREILPA